MYNSNLTHFLDEEGNIAKEMHKDDRELAGFLVLIVDATTKIHREPITAPDVRCFTKGCKGLINITLSSSNDDIHWRCPECKVEGRISGWQDTKWDNIK
jgi:hypothetical protein